MDFEGYKVGEPTKDPAGDSWEIIDGTANCAGGFDIGNFEYAEVAFFEEEKRDFVVFLADLKLETPRPISSFRIRNKEGEELVMEQVYVDSVGGLVATVPQDPGKVVFYAVPSCVPFDLSAGGDWQLIIDGKETDAYTSAYDKVENGPNECKK